MLKNKAYIGALKVGKSSKKNLITLCNSCHLRTNGNREYWQKLFQEKLSKLYNYKYDVPKEMDYILRGGLKK